jgi:CheY-like chemotaxis protein
MAQDSKRVILIVDDDDFTREMYADVFRNSGYEVREARDGVEGLDSATNNHPDVIFTGIVMPRMDGFSLMEALSKNTQTASIPVVISSHLGREEDRKRAEQLGAKDFIVRDTTSPREVVEIVSMLFSEGGEFVLEFDPYALDAQRMAQQLRVNSHFQCMECGEKMFLKVRLTKKATHSWFQVKFVCPKCGWQLP